MNNTADPFRVARQNFSHCIHVLASPVVFKKLNVFEKQYVGNMTKYTKKEIFPTVTTELQTRVHNMYAKYVGFPKQ